MSSAFKPHCVLTISLINSSTFSQKFKVVQEWLTPMVLFNFFYIYKSFHLQFCNVFKVKAEGLWLLICLIHFCNQAGGLWVFLKEWHSEMFLPSMGPMLRHPLFTKLEILSSLCFQALDSRSWMPLWYEPGGRRMGGDKYDTLEPQKS